MNKITFQWDEQKNKINQQKHGISFEEAEPLVKNTGDKPMEQEYDLSKMKKRPNLFAKRLKKQVTIEMKIDVIEYFEMMAKEEGISSQELINLYLQDCVTSQRKLSVN